jgi:hypothetical protein
MNPENLDFRHILAQLPDGWRDLAHDMRLVIEHPDTKVDDPEALLHAVLLHCGNDIPLRQTVAILAKSGGIDISHVTLHRKMKRVGPLLQEIVGRMAQERADYDVGQWGGYEPVLVDGSVVVSPGATGSGGRLHVGLRLADLCVTQAFVTTTEEGETLKRFSWARGQLAIGDRGYANPVGLASVVMQGADVLVRVNRGALPLVDADGQPVDLLEWVRGFKGRGIRSMAATARSENAEVEGRLLATRIPADKRKQARKRARQEFGDDPIALALSEWLLLFTTAPCSRLDDKQVVALYRLRWQVELLYKRWKSLCHLDRLPNYRPDTLVAWLTAKLLLLLCAESIAQPASRRLSPPKPTPTRRRPRRTHARPPTVEAHVLTLAGHHRRLDACKAA